MAIADRENSTGLIFTLIVRNQTIDINISVRGVDTTLTVAHFFFSYSIHNYIFVIKVLIIPIVTAEKSNYLCVFV